MANKEMKVAVKAEFDDSKVKSGTRSATRNVDQMSQRMIRSSQKVNQHYGLLNKTMQAGTNKLIGFGKQFAGAYIGYQVVKSTWNFNDAMRALKNNVGASSLELDKYKAKLADISFETGIDLEDLKAVTAEISRGVTSMDELAKKTEEVKLAMIGAQMSVDESVRFDFEMRSMKDTDAKSVLNRAESIGSYENGRFNSKELALGAFEVMRANGLERTEEMHAQIMSFLQVQSNDTQDVNEAVANFSAFISDLSSERLFIKKRLGVDVFEQDNGKLVLKDLQPIIDLLSSDTEKGRQLQGLWFDQKGTLRGKLSEGGAQTVMALSGRSEQVEKIKNSESGDIDARVKDTAKNYQNTFNRVTDLPTHIVTNAFNKEADPIGNALGLYRHRSKNEEIIDPYGRENFDRWVIEQNIQGYGHQTAEKANPIVIQEIIEKGLLTDEFGLDFVKDLYDKKRGIFAPYQIKDADSDELKKMIRENLHLMDERKDVPLPSSKTLSSFLDTSKILQENALYLKEKQEINVEGSVSVDSKVTVEVKASDGLAARVERQETRTEGKLRNRDKLGYTGGGQR